MIDRYFYNKKEVLIIDDKNRCKCNKCIFHPEIEGIYCDDNDIVTDFESENELTPCYENTVHYEYAPEPEISKEDIQDDNPLEGIDY